MLKNCKKSCDVCPKSPGPAFEITSHRGLQLHDTSSPDTGWVQGQLDVTDCAWSSGGNPGPCAANLWSIVAMGEEEGLTKAPSPIPAPTESPTVDPELTLVRFE